MHRELARLRRQKLPTPSVDTAAIKFDFELRIIQHTQQLLWLMSTADRFRS